MPNEEKIDLYDSLKKRCTKDKLIARTLFADIYKIENTSGGVTSEQEVHHIRIPFDEQKEAILRAKYNMQKEELDDFYSQFRANLQNCNKINKFLAQNNTPSVTRYTRFILAKPNHTDKETNANDIYFVYDNYEQPLIGSEHISDAGAKRSKIIELGLEMLEIIKLYHEMGLCVGTFDLRNMSFGEMGLKNYFFLVGQQSGSTYAALPAKVYAAHMKPGVASGHEPTTAESDMYSVCSLMWGMLQGTHFDLKHDKDEKPQGISNDLIAQLEDGLRGKGNLRDLKAAMNDELDRENMDGFIPFSRPAYQDAVDKILADSAEKEKAAVESQKKEKKKKEKKESSGKSKLKKKDLFGWLGVLALVLVTALIWKVSNPSNAPEKTIDTQTETTSENETAEESVIDTRTSSSERLYVYGGTVVDYYGVPSGRYFISDSGDIVTTPSTYPQSLDELTAKVAIIDVSSVAKDITKGSITLTADQIKSLNISDGSIIISDGVVKKVAAISDNGEEGQFISLLDPYMSDIYENVDDELYKNLLLLSKEQESITLFERTSTANGMTTTLYYDADGRSHSEDEWIAQEQLKEQIAAIKEEMAAYKLVEGEVVVVPASGVEQYVYIESINFAKSSYTITLDKYSYGMVKDTLFLIQASIMPANATCKEVEITIAPTGASVPYAYNGQYILGDYSTYEDINSAVFDFGSGEDGSGLSIVIVGTEYGTYDLTAACISGATKKTVTLTLTDEEGHTEDITEEPEESKADESSAPRDEASKEAAKETSKTPDREESRSQESSAPAAEKKQESSTPKEESSVPPTSTPAQESSSKEVSTPPSQESSANKEESTPEMPESTFTVYPAAVSLKVGESVDLCPSDSCYWQSTNPAVATMGGPQARSVYALSPGSCSIICTAASGEVFYVSVTVN